MALDADEKSVQGIADPAAKKAAFYRAQRVTAEKGASQGDRGAAKTAANIEGKLGNMDKNHYYAAEHFYGKPAADVGHAIQRVSDVAGKALDFAIPEAKAAGAARGFIPKALQGAERVGSSIASRLQAPLEEAGNKARQFLGQAKPVAKKLEGGPRKISSSPARKALTSGERAPKSAKPSQPALPGKAQKALTGGMKSSPGKSAESWTSPGRKPMDVKELYPERRVRSRNMRKSADEALDDLKNGKKGGNIPTKALRQAADIGRNSSAKGKFHIEPESGKVSYKTKAEAKPSTPKAEMNGPRNKKGRVRGLRG